jgi:hypothetical protein
MRLASTVLLVSAGLAVAAPAASATITSSYDAPSHTLTINSDDASDTIAVSCAAGQLKVNDATPPHGAIACGTPGTLILNGNGGADTLDVSALAGASVALGTTRLDGGEGDDDVRGVYFGSNGYVVTLLGAGGNDLLTVNASDVVRGGSGDDRIVGPPKEGGTLEGDAGTDAFAWDISAAPSANFEFSVVDNGLKIGVAGGGASQTVPWTSVEVADLVLTEGAQTVDATGFSGSLRVDGRGGPDTLKGGDGADTLTGGTGNDFLEGGGAADVYKGGAGLDLVHARDGVADTVDCGAEEDTLVADAADAATGCERIDLPVVTPPPAPPVVLPAPVVPADRTKPVLRLGRATLSATGRLRVAVTCPKTEVRCSGTAALSVTGRRGARSVRVALGTVTFSVAGGKSKTLTRTASRAQRRALARLRGSVRLRLSLDVVDGAGNRTANVKAIALKR